MLYLFGMVPTRRAANQDGICPHRAVNRICFFCTRLPTAQRARLHELLQPVTYAVGDSIFHEGERARGVWSICRGQVKLSKYGDEGRSLVTRIIHSGGMIGYRSVLGRTAVYGTAVASEDTKAVFLPAQTFEDLFAREETFRVAVMALMAEDLEHAESLAASMAYNDARSRVLAALAEFRRVRERVVGSLAGWEFSIPRKDLAELTGLTVEAVVRTLKKLEADGVLEIQGRKLRVVDPGAVREHCLHHCTERQPFNAQSQCYCLFDDRWARDAEHE